MACRLKRSENSFPGSIFCFSTEEDQNFFLPPHLLSLSLIIPLNIVAMQRMWVNRFSYKYGKQHCAKGSGQSWELQNPGFKSQLCLLVLNRFLHNIALQFLYLFTKWEERHLLPKAAVHIEMMATTHTVGLSKSRALSSSLTFNHLNTGIPPIGFDFVEMLELIP